MGSEQKAGNIGSDGTCALRRLAGDPSNPNQALSGWDDKPEYPLPEVKEVLPSPDIFSLEPASKGGPRKLLRNIQRLRQLA